MQKDWLNCFIEKNAWGILITLIGITISYTILGTEIKANTGRINTIEEAQIVIVENQKSILELQVNQVHLTNDITEIKEDVKTLLKR